MATQRTSRTTARRRLHSCTHRARQTGLCRRNLRFEPLEDRRLLAALTVTTPLDVIDFGDERLSLREAIFAANTVAGPDTIDFDFGHDGPETIVLTQGELKITDALTITGPGPELLTIDASGNDPTPDEVDRMGSRLFRIDDGSGETMNISISGLRLTGGDVDGRGGAILSAEDLHLADLIVERNASFFSVGGNTIDGTGTLEIERSRIVNNYGSPGYRVSATVFAGSGLVVRESEISDNTGTGGVFSGGEVSITDTTISRNAGTGVHIKSNGTVEILRSEISNNIGSVGGLLISVFDGGTALVSDSTIVRNTAIGSSAFGGGGARLESFGPGFVTIERSAFIENRAPSGGGILASGYLRIIDSEFEDNAATSSDGEGGALAIRSLGDVFGMQYEISGSTFHNNVAGGAGGAISMSLGYSAASIHRSTIIGNSAGSYGGGIYLDARLSTAVIRDSTLHGNYAGSMGGGASITAGPESEVRLEDSTIDANTARNDGGGIQLRSLFFSDTVLEQVTVSGNSANGSGGGLAISFSGGAATIAHSTITFNGFGVQRGGGVFATGSGALLLSHAIVAGNIVPANFQPDVSNFIGNLNVSHSLIGNSSGSGLMPAPVGSPDANGNLVGSPTLEGEIEATEIDARLGPLADNGGPTLTHALMPGSPAINAGDPAAMTGEGGVPFNDQRGAPYTRVYGGRIDIGAFELQPTEYVLGDFNRNGSVDAADYVVWRKQLGTTVSPGTGADGNGDGFVDDADRTLWLSNSGQIASVHEAANTLQTAMSDRATASARPATSSTLDSSGGHEASRVFWPAAQIIPLHPSIRPGRWPALSTASNAERADRALIAWLASQSIGDFEELRQAPVAQPDGKGHVEQPNAPRAAAIDEALQIMLALVNQR